VSEILEESKRRREKSVFCASYRPEEDYYSAMHCILSHYVGALCKQHSRMTSRHEAPIRRRSRLWYLLPIFLHIIGGLITYFVIRGSDDAIAKNSLWLGIILSAVTTTLALAVYLAYVNYMTIARERISTAQVISTAYGPIQYADVGHGTPVLVIHGAGGGFDQGLFTAKGALGDDAAHTTTA